MIEICAGAHIHHDDRVGQVRTDVPLPADTLTRLVDAMIAADVHPIDCRRARIIGETGAFEFEVIVPDADGAALFDEAGWLTYTWKRP